MDIAHLKTFIELSKTRHFGKAANALCITQSAVSARIRQLEESLGVKLLTRDRNNIQLTPAGIRFLPHAEQIATTWSIARQTTALQDENQTLLSIGASHGLWDAGLQRTINRFYDAMDNIALNLEAHNQEQLFRKLMEDALDMCFMFEQPQLKELNSLCVGHLELVLASTYAEESSQQLLQRYNYVLVDWGTEFATTHAKAFGNSRVPSMRVSLARLALNYLLECGGSAYLPKSMIEDYLDSALFIAADAPVFRRDFYLVYKEANQKLELIDQLTAEFKH